LQRHRPSRTAPIWESPTTATPTGAWPSTPTVRIVDGDQIMCILALALRERGALAQDTLVATVMSNLGHVAGHAPREGIEVRQTAVGDRYVLEDNEARASFSLGGEQSGHVIMLDHGTTGDGVLTGLMLAARMAQTRRSIADLGTVMTRLPQVLVNVKGVDKARVETDGLHCQEAIAAEPSPRSPGSSGRVLLRKSGTEPLVRVMVEAADQAQAQSVAEPARRGRAKTELALA
jgi:phosphoglucosamine mutase